MVVVAIEVVEEEEEDKDHLISRLLSVTIAMN